jgi:hypothetical protein
MGQPILRLSNGTREASIYRLLFGNSRKESRKGIWRVSGNLETACFNRYEVRREGGDVVASPLMIPPDLGQIAEHRESILEDTNL